MARPQDHNGLATLLRHFTKSICLVQCPAFRTVPCIWRPPLGNREITNHIGGCVVVVDIEALWNTADDGEGLEGDVGVMKLGKIDMPDRAPNQQIAPPEQAVGMEIGDEK